MECPKCRTQNREKHKFCLECGTALIIKEQTPSTLFAPESERKRVTALFSDLSGYTAMTEKLDPEEVKQIMNIIFEGMKEVVRKFDGFIERSAGDSILVLFGVPKAHEDDPIRAINAAKEIHEFVKSISPNYKAKIGRELSMHSGINTGLAVTADVNPLKGTHGVTGDAINVAARLSDLAKSNEILVGIETYKACKNYFTFQFLNSVEVKGKTDPIVIYKEIDSKASAPRSNFDRQVSSEMVGRGNELDKLEIQVLKVINGEGSVINITGEAGIGKSRLIAELKNREVMERINLLEGRAISIGKNLSFHPIINLIKQWANITESDSESEAVEKLAKTIRSIDFEGVNEILPFVATLMGMKLKGEYAKRVEGLEGEALEKLIVKNVRELMIKSSELQPIIFIMEDLHWADTSSTDLLETLYRLADTYRLLFINVFRPGYIDEKNANITEIGRKLSIYYMEIKLQPLTKINSESLIQNMLEIKGLPYSIREKIIVRAGGNPFFIEEVIRSLIDEGAILIKDNGFEVSDKIDTVLIPSTINDVLVARIDRLEERTRELVKVAAIIGRSFFYRIIKDVTKPLENPNIRLAYLIDIQFIKEHTHMQELEYIFNHALVQEVAYESILLEKRKKLHLVVARSIEKIFQKRIHEFYGMLAYHYGKGENLEKSEEYMTKAGEEALRSSASSEALNYLQQAFKLYVDRHGKNADVKKLIFYKKNLAQAYLIKGNFPKAVGLFEEILVNKGYKSLQGKWASALSWRFNLFAIALKLYLPGNPKMKTLDPQKFEILDLLYKKMIGLVHINSKQYFIDTTSAIKETLCFNLNETQEGLKWVSCSPIAFYISGLLALGAKLLEHVEDIYKSQNLNNTIYLVLARTLHWIHIGSGKTAPQFDTYLIDFELKNGEVYFVTAYLLHLGALKLELGLFNDAELCQQKLHSIIESYGYNFAQVHYHFVRANQLIKTRAIHEALIEAEEGYLIASQSAMNPSIIRFLGLKIIAEVLLGRIKTAESLVKDGERLIAKAKFVGPLYLAPFVLSRLLTHIERLKDALQSGNQLQIQRYKKKAYYSAKQAEKNSRKHVLYKTWIFKSIGVYYWLVKKQRQAIKWWSKSIKEGERLKAHPDLSRTYYEVGKNLLESQSKYQELNGIDAQGYLKKAETLFHEMNLKEDLDDLERLKSV